MREQKQLAEKLTDTQMEKRKKAFQADFSVNTEIMGNLCGMFIYNYDWEGLEDAIKSYLKIPQIIAVSVTDIENRPLAAAWKNPEIQAGKTVPENIGINEKLSFQAEAFYGKEKLGKVQIYYTESLLNAEIRQSREQMQKEISDLRDMIGAKIENLIFKEAAAVFCIVILLAASITVCLEIIAIRPIQRIIETLRTNAELFVSSSEEISAASQTLAQDASKQASSIEEISSSAEEMSSMIKQNADNSNDANLLMKEVSHETEKLNSVITGLMKAMEEISESSRSTSKIIETIDGIAFQTNLLALNAAVEAARAGEAGSGFAVVADEVRNLSMRTATSAKNTAGLIEDTVNKIRDSSDMVIITDEAFSKLVAAISRADSLIKEIELASREQVSGINQISQASSDMDGVTQRNAANAQESAGFSQEMNAQAEQMKRIVDELSIVIKGTARQSLTRKNECQNNGLIFDRNVKGRNV
ncbi:methyl-accepting chemotaxis protein [Desulfonema magnum]|uniref:methyl-accepting chemotaxis protein n=1 Tax=Desulfonema magnum TaxID=45655 RepID=UPI001A9ADDB1|nr:methyl-accepting chemotaxis protein [Desulfonema magnum]